MSDKFFQNELATMLEYSDLLKRERCEEAQKEIQELFTQEANIVGRINSIKQIDEQYQDTKPTRSNDLIQIDDLDQETFDRPRKLKKVSFFSYLFSIRSKLLRLCKHNTILEAKMMGFRFNLSNQTLALLEEIKGNMMERITPIISNIILNGWKILPPKTYNIFFYLNIFLERFTLNFILDKKSINKNFRFIESFSKYYFSLLSQNKYLQEIREGIYRFYANKENDDMESLLLFFEAVTDRRKTFSLLNYILMIYSAFYRQPIDLEKVFELKDLPPIADTAYLTDQKVRYMLQDYLVQLQNKQKQNERKLLFLSHVHDEKPSSLEEFIKRNHDPKFSFDYFSTDLLKSSVTFANAFLRYSEAILVGEVTVLKEEREVRTIIFKTVWDVFIDRLKSSISEIEYQKDSHKYLFVTMSSFEKFLDQGKHLESEKDEKLCQLVLQLRDLFFSYFSTIAKIIYNDYALTHHEKKEEIFDKLKVRNNPIVDRESERLIPFATNTVKEYKGQSVLSVLKDTSAAAGTFLYILHEPQIYDRLAEKSSIIQSSNTTLESILRLKF